MNNRTNTMNFESLENRRMMAADLASLTHGGSAMVDVTTEQVLTTKSPTDTTTQFGISDQDGTIIVCDFGGDNGESTDTHDPMNQNDNDRGMNIQSPTRIVEPQVVAAAFASR